VVESLEERRHLAGNPVVSLVGNTLWILGTTGADDIAVQAGRRSFNVHANGRMQSFKTAEVKLVRVFGLAGHDSIVLSPKFTIRASIEGGPGNDRIGGSAKNDTIFGQTGNDTITGNGGDDYLDAGADDDRLIDGLGVNVFHGGGGVDRSVEDRFHLATGVESRNSAPGERDSDQHYYNGSINLSRVDGRMILRHSGILPSIANSVVASGPTLRPDGNYDIIATFYVMGGGAIVGDFDNAYDLTDVIDSGVVFTAYDEGVDGPTFSVPFLLPTK
jgi:hypothetical protein